MEEQIKYFGYFDRCPGQEGMPPVQVAKTSSEEEVKHFKGKGFTLISEEQFKKGALEVFFEK